MHRGVIRIDDALHACLWWRWRRLDSAIRDRKLDRSYLISRTPLEPDPSFPALSWTPAAHRPVISREASFMVTAEDANVLASVTSISELSGDVEANALFDALPISQLAMMWCALQRISRRDQTGSVWAAKV